jgi:hypothetical protein
MKVRIERPRTAGFHGNSDPEAESHQWRDYMKKLFGIIAAGVLVAGISFADDTAKGNAKKAGSDVKEAGKASGRAVKHTGKAVAKGTKHGVHKAAGATERGAEKVKDKTQQ